MSIVPKVEWRQVIIGGEEWPYEVSNLGRVKGSHIGILKLRSHVGGYVQVCLYKEGVKRYAYVHRLVMEAFVGPCPDGYEVDHMDRNKGNNTVANLRYVTRKENVLRGSAHPNTNLTEVTVLEVRKRLDDLMEKYSVSPNQLRHIADRSRWGWLDVGN